MVVTSPIDVRQLNTFADAGWADAEAVVASARRVHDDGQWSCAAPARRKAGLHRIADAFEREVLALAVRGVCDNGTEISMALKVEPGSAAGTFRYSAEALDGV